MQKLKHYIAFALTVLLMNSSTSVCNAQSISEQRKKYESTDDVSKKLQAGYQLTRAYVHRNHDSALYFGEQCLELSLDEGTDKEIGIAHSALGLTYFYSNEYEKSLEHYRQSNNIFERVGYWKGLGANKSTVSIYYNRIGQNDKAIELALEAYKLLDEHGEGDDVAGPLTALGILYMRNEDYDLATKYLKEAMALYPDSTKTANLLNNLGLIELRQKNYPLAIDYFKRTLHLDSLQNHLGGMSSTYTNLAVCFKRLKNYDSAMFYNLLSLEIDRKLSSQRGMAASMNNIGAILLQLEQYSAARDTFLKGLAITRALNDMGISRDILTNLSDAYLALGQHDSALIYYKEFKVLGDSLNSRERSNKINQLTEGFDLEQRNNKILLLDSQLAKKQQLNYFVIAISIVLLILVAVAYNRYRIKQNLRFQMQHMEYEKRMVQAQMNPHFVFNALGSISSYISQQDKDKAIRYLSKFAKLIRARLESGQKGGIRVEDEVENLKNYLDLEQIRFEFPFTYSINIAEDVSKDEMIPPTLLQPFIENSILHGFVDQDKPQHIEVHIYKKNGMISASVEDNGIGITNNRKMKEGKKPLHESLSTRIIRDYFTVRNRNKKTKLGLTVSDLSETAIDKTGTRVELDLIQIKKET